ncbi:MAG: sigma 54-interacting transcriptional regulator [Syntrophobacteraceae bacterium]|jgi:PAS domain S-box-containing protein
MEDGGRIHQTGLRKLQERADKFQSIFENSTLGIFQSSLRGRFLLVNPAFARILGYDSPQDLKKSIKNIEHQFYHDPGRRSEILSAVQAKEGISKFETDLCRKDGSLITCSMSIRAIRGDEGKVIHMDGFIEDVTEARLREKHLKERSENLSREVQHLRASFRDRYRFRNIIGKSAVMQVIYEDMLGAASSDSSVIVYGESGTGKELVARGIHELSRRRAFEFVPVNCGAIPEHLLESEFFGHKKGAFTGADADSRGYLDRANGGTLFLDEVAELRLDMQVKLLRAIDDGAYFPVGDSKARKSDFRLITATNRNLREMVKAGKIREDFFFRVDVVPIDLPPLRMRREDIPLLIDHFLREITKSENPPVLPGPVLEALYKYDYPGNIRELQNILQRYLAIRKLDFVGFFAEEHGLRPSPSAYEGMPLQESVTEYERSTIERCLAFHQWNRSRTARVLGINRKTLYSKMKAYGLIVPHSGAK